MPRPVVVVGLTVPMSIVLLGSRLQLMRDSGFEVHVVVGIDKWGEVEVPSGVQLHAVEMSRTISPLRDLIGLWQWISLIRAVRPTGVIGATPKAALLAMLASRFMGVPIRVFELWGAAWEGKKGVKGLLLKSSDRIASRCSTQCISVSPSLAELLIEHRICAMPPLVLGSGGSMGVDLHRYHVPDSPNDRDQVVVGYIGRLSQDKGAEDLVEAFQLIREEIPSARLDIIGDFDRTNLPSRATVEFLLSDPAVSISGWVADTAPLIRRFGVLLFPSAREGLPNAILEASASGVPVIAYDVTGTRDAVWHDESGYLVSPGDIGELASRAVLVMKDQLLAESLGSEGRALVANNFDMKFVSLRFVDWLDSMIRGL